MLGNRGSRSYLQYTGDTAKAFAHVNNLLLVIKVSRLLEPTKDEVVNSFCFSVSSFKSNPVLSEKHPVGNITDKKTTKETEKRVKP